MTSGPRIPHGAGAVLQINLSATDQTALVAFLRALSDDRVRYERAPFDHPSLCVSAGANELSPGILAADTSDSRFASSAADRFALVAAVGRTGNQVPLQTFEEMLAGIGNDGSRAHALVETCSSVTALTPRVDAVTHAATFAAGPVSPGEIVAIFGSNLTRNVTFDGIQATVLFFSPAQINVTVPYALAGSTTTVQVGSASLQLAVAPTSPGIFAAVSAGPGLVTLYMTGGGRLSADSLPRLTSPVIVTVNGQTAEVLYAGIAPTLPEGANQVNVRLPQGLSAGPISTVVTIGSVSSQAFLFTP